jgi:septum formation protein
MRLILASASPRRAQILREAGIAFESVRASVDESPRAGEQPMELVARLARAKAEAVAARTQDEALVIGADTEVVLDGAVLGKPADAAAAREMLRRLSGRAHEVTTALEIIRIPDGERRRALEVTRVTFAPLSEREIEDYAASGEPLDKAGGYAIQGIAGRFIPGIEGCYFNVVGLPLARLCALLAELGWKGDFGRAQPAR